MRTESSAEELQSKMRQKVILISFILVRPSCINVFSHNTGQKVNFLEFGVCVVLLGCDCQLIPDLIASTCKRAQLHQKMETLLVALK